MKKSITASLLATIILSLGTVSTLASSEERTGDTSAENSTQLYINNDSKWVMHVPANQVITEASTNIGNVYITGTIEPNQVVNVDVEHEGFFGRVESSDILNFELLEEGTEIGQFNFIESHLIEELKHPLTVEIAENDFENARAGSYETVIVFSAFLDELQPE